jgi:tetratricopeptide (TPR) repeat protein
MGRLEAALVHYRRAAVLYRELEDDIGEAVALNNLGSAHVSQDHLREAEDMLKAALPLARRTDQHLYALVLANLGLVGREQARFTTAMCLLNKGLEVADATGSQYARAVLLETIGHVYKDTGRLAEARSAFEQSFELAGHAENQGCLVASLVGLADTARLTGHMREAEAHLVAAHQTADRIGIPEAMTHVLIGEAATSLARGGPAEALARLEAAGRLALESNPLDVPRIRLLGATALAALDKTDEALAAARLAGKSGQRLVHAHALKACADLHDATGDPAADQVRAEAVALLRDIGVPESAATTKDH